MLKLFKGKEEEKKEQLLQTPKKKWESVEENNNRFASQFRCVNTQVGNVLSISAALTWGIR